MTADIIRSMYQTTPLLLPFAQYRRLPADLNSPVRRRIERDALGLRAGELLITSFGIVSADKAPEKILRALRLLTDTGRNVRLAFCGYPQPPVKEAVLLEARRLKLLDRVHFSEGKVSEKVYLSHLAASDIAVQLRTYKMGGLSGALNDCISAAIPAVANAHLAEAMQSPALVRRVPDDMPEVSLFQAILEIEASGEHVQRPMAATRAFAEAHSPERYARQLLQGLGLDAFAPAPSP
jgi:glycosyltransferase involved in cell wall biosynthesis